MMLFGFAGIAAIVGLIFAAVVLVLSLIHI